MDEATILKPSDPCVPHRFLAGHVADVELQQREGPIQVFEGERNTTVCGHTGRF